MAERPGDGVQSSLTEIWRSTGICEEERALSVTLRLFAGRSD